MQNKQRYYLGATLCALLALMLIPLTRPGNTTQTHQRQTAHTSQKQPPRQQKTTTPTKKRARSYTTYSETTLTQESQAWAIRLTSTCLYLLTLATCSLLSTWLNHSTLKKEDTYGFPAFASDWYKGTPDQANAKVEKALQNLNTLQSHLNEIASLLQPGTEGEIDIDRLTEAINEITTIIENLSDNKLKAQELLKELNDHLSPIRQHNRIIKEKQKDTLERDIKKINATLAELGNVPSWLTKTKEHRKQLTQQTITTLCQDDILRAYTPLVATSETPGLCSPTFQKANNDYQQNRQQYEAILDQLNIEEKVPQTIIPDNLPTTISYFQQQVKTAREELNNHGEATSAMNTEGNNNTLAQQIETAIAKKRQQIEAQIEKDGRTLQKVAAKYEFPLNLDKPYTYNGRTITEIINSKESANTLLIEEHKTKDIDTILPQEVKAALRNPTVVGLKSTTGGKKEKHRRRGTEVFGTIGQMGDRRISGIFSTKSPQQEEERQKFIKTLDGIVVDYIKARDKKTRYEDNLKMMLIVAKSDYNARFNVTGSQPYTYNGKNVTQIIQSTEKPNTLLKEEDQDKGMIDSIRQRASSAFKSSKSKENKIQFIPKKIPIKTTTPTEKIDALVAVYIKERDALRQEIEEIPKEPTIAKMQSKLNTEKAAQQRHYIAKMIATNLQQTQIAIATQQQEYHDNLAIYKGNWEQAEKDFSKELQAKTKALNHEKRQKQAEANKIVIDNSKKQALTKAIQTNKA